MSDYEKTSKEYLDAWRASQADMQDLRDLLDVEQKKVADLRDTLCWIDNRCYKDDEITTVIDAVLELTGPEV